MADKFTVNKVREGINSGKWGVYKGDTLMMVFSRKASATADARRRNAEG